MKKNLILLLCVISGIVPLTAQQQTENYVKTYVAREEHTGGLATIGNKDYVQESIEYLDGIGRTKQSVIRWGAPSGNDVINPVVYDQFGRIVKEYLPYTSSDASTAVNRSGNFRPLAIQGQNRFYDQFYGGTSGDFAFSQKALEASPLSRVLKQAAPGQTWQMNGEHTIDFDYRPNTVADAVKILAVAGNDILIGGNYVAGDLWGNESGDENTGAQQGASREFADKRGRVVLREVKESDANYFRTYYIYDDFDRLRYVVPPAAVAEIMADGNDWSLLNNNAFQAKWLFCYQYDQRGRMTAKRVPGADWMYMIYDRRDRLVLTQDGNQRGERFMEISGHQERLSYNGYSYELAPGSSLTIKGEFYFNGSGGDKTFTVTENVPPVSGAWIFTKYDHFNRPVMTGIYRTNLTRQALQDLIDSQTAMFEKFNPSSGQNNLFGGYSNVSFPTAIEEKDLLTVTYYDRYDFTDEPVPADAATMANGQVVGTQTRVLGQDQWLTMVMFYDDRMRPVKTVSDNHLNGKDVLESIYRNKVSGLVQRTILTHNNELENGPVVITETYTYDHKDRLISTEHQINDQPAILLVQNTYNERSQLAAKQLHGNIQQIDYQYNMRGWLTKINDGTAFSGSDQFGMELKYDAVGQFNGNIGEMSWRTAGGSGTNDNAQTYQYSYDPMSRLTDATHLSVGKNQSFNVSGISYDANGNILTLNRMKNNSNLDLLTYDYQGNQLTRVEDSGDDANGFEDKNSATGVQEYYYDANGNMISDYNKSIQHITYNYLNLPERISFENGDEVNYVYDAAGMKLRKIARTGAGTTISDYVSGIHYKDGVLEFLRHNEGRAVKNGNSFDYEYHLTDHLGNVRATVDESGAVVQRDDFYPFGLTFNSWRNAPPKNNYTYNGKEYQSETGWIDFGARMHSPELGRWFNIDPLAERYTKYSPYNYTLNNPIKYIDPDGRSVEAINGGYRFTGADAQALFSALKNASCGCDCPNPPCDNKEENKEKEAFVGGDDLLEIGVAAKTVETVVEAGVTFTGATLGGIFAFVGAMLIPTSTGTDDVFFRMLSDEDETRYYHLLNKKNHGDGLSIAEEQELADLEDEKYPRGNPRADYEDGPIGFQKMPQGNNQAKNEEVTSLLKEYGLTNRKDQRAIHNLITGKGYNREQIREVVEDFIKNRDNGN